MFFIWGLWSEEQLLFVFQAVIQSLMSGASGYRARMKSRARSREFAAR